MKTFLQWLEAVFDSQGFWTGTGGKGASGILAIANSTSRICLNLRSAQTFSRIGERTVNKQCWGTIGGAVKGSDPLASAKHEVWEESGFSGPYMEIVQGYIFHSDTFQYINYIAVVPDEFPFKPQAGSYWESDGLEWADYEKITHSSSYGGYPMHDGLVDLLRHSDSVIKNFVFKIRENLNEI